MQRLETIRPELCLPRGVIQPDVKKDQPAIFGPLNKEELNFMSSLKKAMMSPPGLALHSHSVHRTLDVDACNVKIGCLLLQEQLAKTAKPV